MFWWWSAYWMEWSTDQLYDANHLLCIGTFSLKRKFPSHSQQNHNLIKLEGPSGTWKMQSRYYCRQFRPSNEQNGQATVFCVVIYIYSLNPWNILVAYDLWGKGHTRPLQTDFFPTSTFLGMLPFGIKLAQLAKYIKQLQELKLALFE